MFTPQASIRGDAPSMGTRSRRRQRPLSTDNLHVQPKAKRQRVPLSEQVSVNPGVSAPDNFEVKSNRMAMLETKQDGFEVENATPVPKKDITVRSKKHKASERTAKGDGSFVLTSNNAYTVSKLPSLPERLRTDANCRCQGSFYTSGFALSLSHTHALVWPYTSAAATPETFTFALPYPSARASDPLPLGCLVSPSAASNEPGLVIVMPVSGKITYWEAISSAATFDFMRQQRNGVEDVVPGMLHGETVVQVLSAEPAGFILAFSSGRVAYMSVRDPHGRPAISVQFLRGHLGSVSGGLFGSIRTVFSQAGSRGEIVAVRSDRSSKSNGERTVVAATAKGKIHSWRVQRGGHHDTFAEVDVRETILASMQTEDRRVNDYLPDTFEIVDFTFAPKGLESKYHEVTRLSDATRANDSVQQLVLLVSLNNGKRTYYCLCELILTAQNFQIGMIRPISTYDTPVSSLALVKPRLYIPQPALVAYIVFDRAVVVASIAVLPESPDSQIQMDNHITRPAFEDVIDLQQDDSIEIVGSGFEEPHQGSEEARSHRFKTKNPTVVFLVRGAGVLRISTNEIDRFANENPPEITARSKLEQAVVYGAKNDCLLTFSGRELPFTTEQIGDAAVELSKDIITSKIPLLQTMTTSMESHLITRVEALNRLMAHINTLGVDIDRVTRWKLLYNAEKMTVAAFIWSKHEAYTEQRSNTKFDKKSIVAEVVEYIHRDQKTDPNFKAGEVDRARHWFMNDIHRLDIFLSWAYEVVKYIYKDRLRDEAELTRYIYESADLNTAALAGALDYRAKKLAFYGLAHEHLKHGILVSGYEGLPEPWTANRFVANNTGRNLELCERWLSSHDPSETKNPHIDPQLLEAIRNTLPKMTDQWLLTLQEQYRWATYPDNPHTTNYPDRIKFAADCERLYQERHEPIVKLAHYGLWSQTFAVAEKHEAIEAMTEVMIHEIVTVNAKLSAGHLDSAEVREAQERLEAINRDFERCFREYGKRFGFATFDILLRLKGVEAVLDFMPELDKQYGYRTLYLRTKPELAKISWINEVERENDIDRAADTLISLGLTRENQVWSKKIELSLGKLALLAQSEETLEDDAPKLFAYSKRANASHKQEERQNRLKAVGDELELIKIQDRLFQQVLPTVQNAIDEQAELQLAMEVHGAHVVKSGNKALRHIFENALIRLLKHEALDPLSLVDLLTLIAFPADAAPPQQEQFFLALRVAKAALRGEEQRDTQRLIWRRLYIRDDWAAINKGTSLRSDQAVQELVAGTVLFETCYAVAHAFPDPDPSVAAPYKPIKPAELYGLYISELDHRFNTQEQGLKAKMLEAMKEEEKALKNLVQRHRLDNWVTSTNYAAEGFVTEEMDMRTANGAVGMDVDGKSNGHA